MDVLVVHGTGENVSCVPTSRGIEQGPVRITSTGVIIIMVLLLCNIYGMVNQCILNVERLYLV